MNVVDSSGWLEYLAEGPHQGRNRDHLALEDVEVEVLRTWQSPGGIEESSPEKDVSSRASGTWP